MNVIVLAEDRIGLVADISHVLGNSGLRVEAMNVEPVCGKARVSIETDNPGKARGVLESNGFRTAPQAHWSSRPPTA